MSDDASAGPATSAMHDSERVLQRVETAVTRIGAVAGAAAATVVLVAVVGGAVMWLRFRNAGLPADQAVALVPRADLIVIGLRLMVLPVAAAGVLSAGYAWWQRSRTREEGAGAEAAAGAAASAPIAVTACEPGGWAPAARRVTTVNGAGGEARDGAGGHVDSPAETVGTVNGARGDASDGAARPIGPPAETVATVNGMAADARHGAASPIGPPAETAATVDGTRGDGWRRQEAAWMFSRRAAASGLMSRARPPLLRILAVLVVLALVLCVPFTAGALAWPLAAVLLLHHHRRVCRTCPRRPERGVPVARLAAAAMLAAALVSVARQVDPPVQLPSVHVVASGEAVDGTLVTANASTVALAPIGSRSIRVYRRSDVRELLVGPPLDRRAPGRSLLSRLLAGRAWAATPLDVWCGGEHYSWWRLGAACRTQPAVERPVFRSGRSVVATACLPAARGRRLRRLRGRPHARRLHRGRRAPARDPRAVRVPGAQRHGRRRPRADEPHRAPDRREPPRPGGGRAGRAQPRPRRGRARAGREPDRHHRRGQPAPRPHGARRHATDALRLGTPAWRRDRWRLRGRDRWRLRTPTAGSAVSGARVPRAAGPGARSPGDTPDPPDPAHPRARPTEPRHAEASCTTVSHHSTISRTRRRRSDLRRTATSRRGRVDHGCRRVIVEILHGRHVKNPAKFTAQAAVGRRPATMTNATRHDVAIGRGGAEERADRFEILGVHRPTGRPAQSRIRHRDGPAGEHRAARLIRRSPIQSGP